MWRYPALVFQTVLKKMKGENGWRFAKYWSPKFFEQMLEEEKPRAGRHKKKQDQFDELTKTYHEIIFPNGFDAPSIRSVPVWFRAIHLGRDVCAVSPANYGDGLFATADLPIGTTWLLGGQLIENAKDDESIAWNGMSIGPAPGWRNKFHKIERPLVIDDGLIAWKANEPKKSTEMNAVCIGGTEGLLLTLIRDVNASKERPVEILWFYGPDYERAHYNEKFTKKQMDDLEDASSECAKIALKALHMVHGVKPRSVYKVKPK